MPNNADIKLFLHNLFTKGFKIVFCWIPSHCLIMGNEWADRAARQGTNNSTNSTHIHIPLSVNEIYSQLHSASQDNFYSFSSGPNGPNGSFAEPWENCFSSRQE